jgi:hypothetical protein
MSNVRVVSIGGLRRRLCELLGARSVVFESFDRALCEQDEAMISAAMLALEGCPASLRAQVHDTVVDWLFDSSGSDLVDLPAASTALN